MLCLFVSLFQIYYNFQQSLFDTSIKNSIDVIYIIFIEVVSFMSKKMRNKNPNKILKKVISNGY